MKRLLQFIILTPVAIVAVAFAVANRQDVSVSFDPFTRGGDILVTAPLFVILILALMCGVVLGGTFTWFSQGRHRRALRAARSEAARWRGEAEHTRTAALPQQGGISSGQGEAAATHSRRLMAHS